MKDSKSIIYKSCPICFHNRAIENSSSDIIKCARCKQDLREKKK